MSTNASTPRRLLLTGPLKARLDVRALVVCGVLVILCLGLVLLSLMLGERYIGPDEVFQALNGGGSRALRLFVVTWRLPRAVAAVVVGALLGASGAIFQTVTRNPLGSPDVIGFTTGAHTGGLIAILLFSSSYAAVTGGALAGGLATAALVLLLARRGSTQGFRLIIVGIALTAMLASIDTYLILTADLDLAVLASTWAAGSLNGVAWGYAGPSLVLGLLLLACAVPLARPLAQLDLGDDSAKAIGARPETTRLLAVFLGVAMVAVATTVAGPIAFVALAAPQVGRRLTRSAGTPMAPAACTGAVLLLAADLVVQHGLGSRQLPVGVLTVSIGGLYLLYLIVHENRKGTL